MRTGKDDMGEDETEKPDAPESGRRSWRTASRQPRTRRRRWPYIALVAAVMLLVGGWSVFWRMSVDRVTAHIEAELAQLETEGYTVECAERRIGGYPFRIEVRCARLNVRDERLDIGVTTGPTVALAMIYDPQRIIVEVEAPVRVTAERVWDSIPVDPSVRPPIAVGSANIDIDWARARASLQLAGERMTRLDAVVDAPQVRGDDLEEERTLSAETLELHTRERESEAQRLMDAALSVRGLAAGSTFAAQPFDFDFQVTLPAAGTLPPANEPLPVDIVDLRLRMGDIDLSLRGRIAADATGRWNGRLHAAVKNAMALITQFDAGVGLAPVLATALTFAGSRAPPKGFFETEDFEGAMFLTFSVDEGAVSLGSFLLTELPPISR